VSKKKRGRETAYDMMRSLGICMLVVVPIWYLAQPPDSAEQAIRLVDQAPAVQAWDQVSPGAPVPGAVPTDWQPTVAQNVRQPPGLRLGWVTGPDRYTEFATSTGARGPFLEELTGGQTGGESVDVDGTAWQRWVDTDDGSVSLVRSDGAVTVVVGSRRSTATEDELRELASSVRP
jgi:hypothetical protein